MRVAICFAVVLSCNATGVMVARDGGSRIAEGGTQRRAGSGVVADVGLLAVLLAGTLILFGFGQAWEPPEWGAQWRSAP